MADNTITVIGNVTRDPELRFAASGNPQVTFGLAVNRRWQNRQTQEWDESTSFFDIVCWGSLAENCADSIGKGTRVLVTGRLEQRSWETQDGEKRSKIEVVADEVGPSLRWATARVEKSDRRGGGSPGGNRNFGGGGNQQGGNQQGGNQQGGNQQGGGRQESVPAASGGGYSDNDEEPF
jgi:single-strand DNA-binding protein